MHDDDKIGLWMTRSDWNDGLNWQKKKTRQIYPK